MQKSKIKNQDYNVKFKIILGFGLAILVFTAYGYLRAVPEQNNLGGPRIVVEPKSWDFGEVRRGAVVSYSFGVRNEGREILEIKRVATSCACATAKIAKEKISPGEKVNLRVVYDTGAMSGAHAKGNQERIIYIKSNDSTNPQLEVTIYASVK